MKFLKKLFRRFRKCRHQYVPKFIQVSKSPTTLMRSMQCIYCGHCSTLDTIILEDEYVTIKDGKGYVKRYRRHKQQSR